MFDAMLQVLASTLESGPRLLLLVLILRSKGGERYTAVSSLVEDTQLSEASVHRHLAALKGAGIIEPLHKPGEPGRWRVVVESLTTRPGVSHHETRPSHHETPLPPQVTPQGSQGDTPPSHGETQDRATSLSVSLSERETRVRAHEVEASAQPNAVAIDLAVERLADYQRSAPTKRDLFAIRKALEQGRTEEELRRLLDYMRASEDKDPVCSRKGPAPWGESYASVLTRPERFEAAARWLEGRVAGASRGYRAMPTYTVSDDDTPPIIDLLPRRSRA